MSELTEWFPPEVTPAREGVYEVKPNFHQIGAWYSHWCNGEWLGTAGTPERAISFGLTYGPTSIKNLSWRGLAQEPKQ